MKISRKLQLVIYLLSVYDGISGDFFFQRRNIFDSVELLVETTHVQQYRYKCVESVSGKERKRYSVDASNGAKQ